MCEIATVLDPASATELLTMIPANSSAGSSVNHMTNDENYQPQISNRGGFSNSSAQKLEYRSPYFTQGSSNNLGPNQYNYPL